MSYYTICETLCSSAVYLLPLKPLISCHLFSIGNFCRNLARKDAVALLCGFCLVLLIIIGLLQKVVDSQASAITANLPVILTAFPLICCLMLVLGRVAVRSEKSLDRIFDGIYAAMPIESRAMFDFFLIISLLKDTAWFVLGITLLLIIAEATHHDWLLLIQPAQLTFCWVVVGSLAASVSMLLRIIVAGSCAFNSKFTQTLLAYGEVVVSLVGIIVILAARQLLALSVEPHQAGHSGTLEVLYLIAVALLLFFFNRRLSAKHEPAIRAYFENREHGYSTREVPAAIETICSKLSSPLLRGLLRVTLASRSYGITAFTSLVVIVVQAMAFLLFSLALTHRTASLAMFVISSTLFAGLSFSLVFTQLRFVFDVTRSLPVAFNEAVNVFARGGLVLALPVLFLTLLLSTFFGLPESILATCASLSCTLCVVLLRLFISLRYPQSRRLADLLFSVTLCLVVLFFPLILVVLYYRNKARQIWNANALQAHRRHFS